MSLPKLLHHTALGLFLDSLFCSDELFLYLLPPSQSPCMVNAPSVSPGSLHAMHSVWRTYTSFISFLYICSHSVVSSNASLNLDARVASAVRLYFPQWLQQCFQLSHSSGLLSFCSLPACGDWAFVTAWRTIMCKKWCSMHSQAGMGDPVSWHTCSWNPLTGTHQAHVESPSGSPLSVPKKNMNGCIK